MMATTTSAAAEAGALLPDVELDDADGVAHRLHALLAEDVRAGACR
jgi:hypothetical protein